MKIRLIFQFFNWISGALSSFEILAIFIRSEDKTVNLIF